MIIIVPQRSTIVNETLIPVELRGKTGNMEVNDHAYCLAEEIEGNSCDDNVRVEVVLNYPSH